MYEFAVQPLTPAVGLLVVGVPIWDATTGETNDDELFPLATLLSRN